MKKVIFGLLALSVSSCLPFVDRAGNDAITIAVENQTGTQLDQVNVYVVQFINVPGGNGFGRVDSSQIGTLDNRRTGVGTLYEKNIQNADGSYLLTATDATGRRYEKTFGYLTNGHFMGEMYSLTVRQDTILVKQ